MLATSTFVGVEFVIKYALSKLLFLDIYELEILTAAVSMDFWQDGEMYLQIFNYELLHEKTN